MSIYDLGYTDSFAERSDKNSESFSIGRIVQVHKESYIISDGCEEYYGKLTGKLIFSSNLPEDFPAVGDFVHFENFKNDSMAIIHKVLRRKSLLKRKCAGKKIEYQPIAANVDYGIIMQGLNNDFNIKRLERYIVMLKEFDVAPLLIFSKSDLLSLEELNSRKMKIKDRYSEIRSFFITSFDKKNISEVKSVFLKKKTYCLIGSSGAGKTTLINNLKESNTFATREVRKSDSRGRHTTTTRHLVILSNGAMIIDNPGMRELANISASEGIRDTFDELALLADKCKFNDCSHTIEKGCALLEALESGVINKSRYDNFIKLRKESDYYERSYLDNRRRDKKLGKLYKSIMKINKKNRRII